MRLPQTGLLEHISEPGIKRLDGIREGEPGNLLIDVEDEITYLQLEGRDTCNWNPASSTGRLVWMTS